MNLLPKSHEEFKQEDYWDSFFKKRGNKAFEWYGEYPELCEHLHKYIKPKDNVLIVGCGNSTLGNDLYDIGYSKITSIDVSQVAIRQMLKMNKKKRQNMKFIQMDALNMTFEKDMFTTVLDKGTLDALMCDDKQSTQEQIIKYFNEIIRVLKVGGRYVCISLLQEQILKILITYFPTKHCMFRAVRCYEAEKVASEAGGSSMPVFMIICTKFLNLPMKILELNLSSVDKMQRLNTELEVIKLIKEVQDASFVCSALKKTSIQDHNNISFDLFIPGDVMPRFTVFVVDIPPERKNMQYAAFIVPQGRESEWLFSTEEGRKQLAASSNSNRMAIITMHRGQVYADLDAVKSEIGDTVLNFAPLGLATKILFLSMGADVGQREVMYEGHSECSGGYVVEDILCEEDKFRRLYYLNSQLVIQSEARLKKVKSRKGNVKEIVDRAYLTCGHHIYMSLATYMCINESNVARIVIIGLGGGGLCSFLGKFLPKMHITAVDIDRDMLKVAVDWFGLTLNENMQVEIMDGLEFLRLSAQKGIKFDGILFDVDSKDTSIGMSCPPKEFLEDDALTNLAQTLNPNGIFALNAVVRDTKLRGNILKKLNNKFSLIASYKLDEDLNEVFICTNGEILKKTYQNKFEEATKELNKFFETNNMECLDVNDLKGCLQINFQK